MSTEPPRSTTDAQINALLAHSMTLAEQIAELTMAQQTAAESVREAKERMTRLETHVADISVITMEVRDLLGTFRSGFKVLGWLGVAAKWVGGIAAAGTAVYTAIYMLTHGGHLPGGHLPPGPK